MKVKSVFTWIIFTISILQVSCRRRHRPPGSKSRSQDEDSISCGPNYVLVHRSCLRFYKYDAFDFDTARATCQLENADLFVVSDTQELATMKPVLRKQVTGRAYLDWWVGLKYDSNRSEWTWIDGTGFHRQLPGWAPGEPNGGDCGLFNYQGVTKDEDCTRNLPFICEELKVTEPPTTQPTTTTTTTEISKEQPATVATPGGNGTTVATPGSNETTAATPGGKETTETSPSNTTDSQDGKTTGKPTLQTTTAKTPDQQTSKPIKPTNKPNTATQNTTDPGKPGERETGKPDDKTPKPTDHPNNYETGTPRNNTNDKTTKTPPGGPDGQGKNNTPRPTDVPKQAVTKDPVKEQEKFAGCFAVNYETTCPPVEAFGISWPRAQPGEVVHVPCENGKASWRCDKRLVCWKNEPNVRQCTSQAIQDLTNQMDEVMKDPNNTQAAVDFTESLANTAAETDKPLSEQDLYQSTVLMNTAAYTKPNSSKSAKTIMTNVVQCGSSLMSAHRKSTWDSMSVENKRSVAANLIKSIEDVTSSMVKVYDEPTVEQIKRDTMVVELQVIRVADLDNPMQEIKYESESNSVRIPPNELKKYTSGGLARLVFINYETVDTLLPPADRDGADRTSRQVVSQVVSASIADKPEGEKLNQTVRFTFRTDVVDNTDTPRWKQMCSFWNFSLGFSGEWSQKGCDYVKHNASHVTCECDHLTNFAILLDVHGAEISEVHARWLSYITYVGIIISIICCFLSLVTFICLSLKCMRGSGSSYGRAGDYECGGSGGSYSGPGVHTRSVQGERNSIHKHLVFVLFVAEVLFLAGIDRTDHKIACAIIAGCLHFFFLSSFMWMFIEGIHILFMLVQVFDAAKSRVRYYYLLGYGAPFLTVGISALVYHEGYGTEQYCWLSTEKYFIWSFAGPVALILLTNLMILIYAMSAVCKHSEYVFAKEKTATGNIKAWIQGALALEVLLGLTWVFGYFYISEAAIPMAYLFTIFNSLQGLFIFIFHCVLNKKVRKEYERFIDYPGKSASSATTHSTKNSNGSGPLPSRNKKQNTEFVDLQRDRKNSSKSSTDV